MAHQTKFEALRESLRAADEQIVNQKTLNTQLELEVRSFALWPLFKLLGSWVSLSSNALGLWIILMPLMGYKYLFVALAPSLMILVTPLGYSL